MIRLIILFLTFFAFFLNAKEDFNISKNYKFQLQNLNRQVVIFGNDAFKDKHYIDFGIAGKLYDIKEENFFVFYEKEKTKLKKYLSKQYIKKKIEETIKKDSYYKSNKPLCLRDFTVGPVIDYIKAPIDIINPLGRIIIKKGEKIPSKIPNGKTLDLCFVDGKGNKITTINQINYFKNKVPNCIFLVSNYNIMELRKKFPFLNIYASSIMQEKRFSIKCYPVHIQFFGVV